MSQNSHCFDGVQRPHHWNSLHYKLSDAVEHELIRKEGFFPDVKTQLRLRFSEAELRCIAEIAAYGVLESKLVKVAARRPPVRGPKKKGLKL